MVQGIKYVVFTAFLFTLSGIAFTQPQLPPSRNFMPNEYGEHQPPENYSICRDQRGFIYAGNVGGVLQYNGRGWKFIHVVTGTKINALDYCGNNKIACGGLNFIGFIAPDEKGNMIFSSIHHLLPKALDYFEVITIHHIGSKIYFQSENAIIIYENGKVNIAYPETTFFRAYSCNDRYFVRERQLGLMEFKGTEKKVFASDSVSANYGYFGIVDYNENEFLAASYDLGFYLINKKDGSLQSAESFFYYDYLPLIYDLEKLENNQYALATVNHGVIILDKDLELDAKISKNEGLRSSQANQICTDNRGNIWAATQNGISLIDVQSPLQFYSESTGLPGNIEAVNYLGTNYYAGSSAGLFLLPESIIDDKKPWRKIEAVNSSVMAIDCNERDVLVASSGGLFAGTLNSFLKISDGNYISVKFIPGIDKIISLTPDLLEIYDNKYKLIKKIPLPVHLQRSLTIAYDTIDHSKTRIWIGLVKQGVLRLDIRSGDVYTLELFDELDGLQPGDVRPYNFIGKIIFLTNKGLQHFIPEEVVVESLSEEEKSNPKFARGFFDSYQIPEIKLDGQVTSMAMENGRIYFVINNKLCYFDESGKKHAGEFSTLKLGRINAIIAIKNNIWIAAADGSARFNPFHLKKIRRSFHVYFDRIENKNGDAVMNGLFKSGNDFSEIQDPSFIPEYDYKNNSFTFEIATDYFDWNHKLEYSYYLEGHDKSWSKWGRDNKIVLSNLHEGSYTLHVKARNVYGVKSEEATYSFIVLAPWYRTWWAYVLYLLIAVLVIFAAIRISSHRLKQSNIRLEKTVQERTMEIASKNDELQEQNEQILHQKKEITDSIFYARRIQEAILPLKEEIKKVFPESFVLYKPKDIVSGDFYWFGHKDNQSIFICADCTGHGVPGAFMSMICTDRINHTVLEKKIKQPSELLSEVNQGIKRSLKQEDETNLTTKDGMDCAVCLFDHEKSELIYAGANRPLWLCRNGEIIEYKPTKMAVGGFTPEEQIFENNSIKIEKGDIVYLSTDGYADQFGGPRGKKLMVKAFKEILLKNHQLPFEEQHAVLDRFIEDWRLHENEMNEDIEQIDDMCVIGIKF